MLMRTPRDVAAKKQVCYFMYVLIYVLMSVLIYVLMLVLMYVLMYVLIYVLMSVLMSVLNVCFEYVGPTANDRQGISERGRDLMWY